MSLRRRHGRDGRLHAGHISESEAQEFLQKHPVSRADIKGACQIGQTRKYPTHLRGICCAGKACFAAAIEIGLSIRIRQRSSRQHGISVKKLAYAALDQTSVHVLRQFSGREREPIEFR
ncbi:MAG TPA: hypothetical protein VGJ21_03670 [Terracidiphilus sp.]